MPLLFTDMVSIIIESDVWNDDIMKGDSKLEISPSIITFLSSLSQETTNNNNNAMKIDFTI